MSLDWTQDVLDFHEKFGAHIGERAGFPDASTFGLRLKLVREEYTEFMLALMRRDLAEVADGALDLVYVVIGTLVTLGIDPRPIWNEIQRANMGKEGGGKREDGKILKPPGWTPPDVAGILKSQGWSGE